MTIRSPEQIAEAIIKAASNSGNHSGVIALDPCILRATIAEALRYEAHVSYSNGWKDRGATPPHRVVEGGTRCGCVEVHEPGCPAAPL